MIIERMEINRFASFEKFCWASERAGESETRNKSGSTVVNGNWVSVQHSLLTCFDRNKKCEFELLNESIANYFVRIISERNRSRSPNEKFKLSEIQAIWQ